MKLTPLLVATLFVLTGISCTKSRIDKRTNNEAVNSQDWSGPDEVKNTVENPADITKVDPPQPVVGVPTVGLRHFNQLNLTMSSLTGVSSQTQAVRDDFTALSAQLPKDNDITASTPAKFSAAAKLATRYCDTLVRDGNLSTAVFGDFNLQANGNDAAAAAPALADRILDRFWGANVGDKTVRDEAKTELVALAQAIAQNGGQNAGTNVALAMCTATLGSAPVVMY